jgi:two-component sensor histidine kinase
LNAHISQIISEDESRRLAAVKRYDILDTPPEGAFDRITAIAARRVNVPVSIISIVDTSRIWFKSHHGVDIDEIAREAGLCATAIFASEPYIVNDAQSDPRTMGNSLVTGGFGLRFYAGIPLQTSDDERVGTLCVIDTKPRTVEANQIADLQDLASVVMDQMELRIAARRAVAHAKLMTKEIDHRMMNSLQFISSMLEMQSRAPELDDPATLLQIAANRVAAVAQVHRNYFIGEGAEVSCIAFLHRLCAELAGILGRRVRVQGEEGAVPSTQIQPIGLIVNELVTNAAKHGQGEITVDYRVSGGTKQLTVWDEGAGPPAEAAAPGNSGLGMKVVRSLSRQLRGQVTLGRSPGGRGSAFTVSFP